MTGMFDPEAFPLRLNLGCGYDRKPGYLNVDFQAFHEPDLVADVTDLAMLPDGRYEEIVAQEALPDADEGDVRLFVMNGEPLVDGGHHAAFRRVNTTGDKRSNMRVGGEARTAKVTDAMLEVVEAVRPKLIADGMFLVGLDIVGDKLVEVNVFSPGGLGSCEQLYKVRFTETVIDALERKVELRRHYGRDLGNKRLATL